MSEVSTHILDTVLGEPARGVVVRLERAGAAGAGPRPPAVFASTDRTVLASTGSAAGGQESADRTVFARTVLVGRAETDGDGRIAGFGAGALPAGTYRLVFETGAYLGAAHAGAGGRPFFPEVVVTFEIDGQRPKYHVPLLLSPYSYSTYRGS